MISPNVKYFILDIPESLWFSYQFLAVHFPEAKIAFCATAKELSKTDGCDFVLVGLPFLKGLSGMRFDMVVNTASLGEMSDSAVERYMRFIQDEIEVRYFYSNNRYGQLRRTQKYTGIRLPSTDCAKAVLRLDPFWSVHYWNIFPDNFIMFETNSPPSLEVLVERMPRKLMPENYRIALSQRRMEAANLMAQEDNQWQFLVWESIRLHPNEANLIQFLHFLHRNGFVELHYYIELYERITGKKVNV